MVVVRLWYTAEDTFAYLIWNLALAWIPVVCAMLAARNRRILIRFPLVALWLVFLPNAPYIVTDYVHLAGRQIQFQSAYDAALITVVSAIGLGLAVWSLRIVDRGLLDASRPLRRCAALSAIVIAMSVGVYLGRIERLNSWDLVLSPGDVLRRAWEGASARGALAFAAAFAIGFMALYGLLGRIAVKIRKQPSGSPALSRSRDRHRQAPRVQA